VKCYLAFNVFDRNLRSLICVENTFYSDWGSKEGPLIDNTELACAYPLIEGNRFDIYLPGGVPFHLAALLSSSLVT